MHHNDRKVRFKPKYEPNQWAFVDKLPLASRQNTTVKVAAATYEKLQCRKAGAFCINKNQLQTNVTDEDFVFNKFSIHRVPGDSWAEGCSQAP